MTYKKVDMLKDLQDLAAGKPTQSPTELLAAWAVSRVQAGVRDRELDELERLYRLEDTRG